MFSRLIQYWSVTDTQTDRRTDKQTTMAHAVLTQRRVVKIKK